MSRQRDFLMFCAKALGSPQTAPLREQNGALVGALVEAFKVTHPVQVPEKQVALQTFEDAIYSEPWSCYAIRNMVTGASYIGIARGGFLSRYAGGKWWEGHKNPRLMRDALSFGLMNFRVLVYVCIDEKDMKRQEAELLRANRMFTYNIRPEADNEG